MIQFHFQPFCIAESSIAQSQEEQELIINEISSHPGFFFLFLFALKS